MAKYTDEQRTAALDAVDALIESGSSVNAALKRIGAEHGISPGTIRSWRSRHGRSQPVGDRKEAVAVAQEALVERVNEALVEHLEASRQFTTRAVALLENEPQSAARLMTAATSGKAVVVDKLVKTGRIEGAERTKSEVEVSIDPEQVKRMSDDEIAALLGEG